MVCVADLNELWGSKIVGDHFQFCGLDCGKQSVTACAANDRPDDLKRFATTYRVKSFNSTLPDLQKLADLAQIYFIEPTGLYYRIFCEYLTRAGKTVLLVQSRLVRSHCQHHGISNKSDRIDPAGILDYGIEKLRNPRAFIEVHNQDLRDICSKLRSLDRQKQPIQSLLGARLCYEVPEWVKVYEQSDRDWLESEPPALWRFIAGQKAYNHKKRELELDATHGMGLSNYSRKLADRLCTYERWEHDLEYELAEVLGHEKFKPYHEVFDLLHCPNKVRAHLLTVCYPFERFLLPDGRVDRIQVIGLRSKRPDQLTWRNKSLQAFKLFNGLGTVLKESGSTSKEIAGGSPYIRSQWWRFVKTAVVLRRPAGFAGFVSKQKELYGDRQAWLNEAIVHATADRFGVSIYLAEAWVHYQEVKRIKPIHDHQVMTVVGRMVLNLFRLLKQYV